MSPPAHILEELTRLEVAGVVAVVGTSDGACVPELSRAWGLRLLPTGDAVEVCIYARSGQRTLANLAVNGHAAVTITVPSTYRSLQVKGRASLMAMDEDDLRRVADHQRVFVEEVAAVGMPRGTSVRLFEDERNESPAMMKIRVGLDAVFDQTPGPGAGARP